MAVPNIDTFEQDVAEEIKHKEASFTDIAAASNDVGNNPEPKKSAGLLVPFLIIFLFLLLAGAGGSYYYFFVLEKQSSAAPALVQTEQSKHTLKPEDISQTIAAAIGSSIESVQTSEYGFTFKLKEYTPAYAYMLRNESAYADELASAVGSARDTSTSTPPFAFTDITISNQNMRVGTSASSTVLYAFVDTSYLVVSSSTQGILSLRSAILK